MHKRIQAAICNNPEVMAPGYRCAGDRVVSLDWFNYFLRQQIYFP